MWQEFETEHAPELTLEKAIQLTRESEMLKSQKSTVRVQQQEQSGTMVDYVESKHKSQMAAAKSNPHYKSDSDVVEPL